MKRIFSVLLIALLLVLLAECAAQTAELSEQTESQQEISTSELEKTVVFTDPALEAMVRGAMGKPEGGITLSEAETVTRLNISFDWQRYVAEAVPIKDLNGLECFKNLEILDLSGNSVTDITPLAGLTKLTILVLDDDPVADIAPLAALINLKVLAMSGCAARDYSAIANLTNLEMLKLNNSAITDSSPLASLTNLKRLYLGGCLLSYTPLADIYDNLIDKDFIIASTLSELGFIMDDGIKQAIYDSDQASVRINHAEWGQPDSEMALNCVRVVTAAADYKVDIGYYPIHDVYVVMAFKDDLALNYLYFPTDGSFGFGVGDRESSEDHVRAIFPDPSSEDVLLEPISYYNRAIRNECGFTAAELFDMPYEPLTLNSLGFFFSEENADYEYHEHEPHDSHISIYRPEWGNSKDGQSIDFYDDDVNGYSLLIMYFLNEGKYTVGLHKNGMECAYDIYPDKREYSGEYPDSETVRELLGIAFGKEDIDYFAPHEMFDQYVQDRFGMSIEELYALPVE